MWDSLYDGARRNGAGYYYATIQYLSRDITKIQCSEESPVSSLLYHSKFYGKALDEIVGSLGENSPKEDILAAVRTIRDMGAGKLAAAMQADQDNSGAAGQIKTLEKLAEITVRTEVCDDLSKVIDQAKVTMTGAGLNADPGQIVTLKIDRPAGEAFVIPAMYDSAEPFSIKLVDGENRELPLQGGALNVPVKLTLPIPEKSLVLMRRYSDGTYGEISKDSDGTSATFMLRTSGDYILAKRTDLSVRKKPDEGIHVTLKSNPGGRELTAALAVFDTDGKLLGVSLASINDEASTIKRLIPCDPDAVSLLKVMILDDGKPAERARSVLIK